MSEPAFLRQSPGLTLAEIVAMVGAAMPSSVGDRRLTGTGALDSASPADLSFFENRNYADAARLTRAGGCLTTAALAAGLPADTAPLIVAAPYQAFVTVARTMFPQALRPSSLAPAGSVAGAHVDKTARLESDITIEPGAGIGPRTYDYGPGVGSTVSLSIERNTDPYLTLRYQPAYTRTIRIRK